MSGIARPQSSKSRKKNVVGITSRDPESNFSWLKYLMKDYSDLLEMTYIPITKDNRWKERVRECSGVILYHTTPQGRINVANVDGALYDDELRHLINFLGREKVVVLLDDMEDISEEEKWRILGTQIFRDLLSSHLILIPKKNKSEAAKIQLTEFCTTLSKGASTSQQKESPGLLPYLYSTISRWAGGTEHRGSKTNGKGERAPRTSANSSHPPYQIGIFSRSAEINYKWLADRLKEDDHKKSFDIKSFYITNDYETFRSGLQTCRFAILYHTLKQGRLNITDVADSLYDEELRDMSNFLGRENVIVVADDVMSGEPEDKERILTHQPSICTYAEDLFLFTEDEKHTRSLETMKDIIQSSVKRSQQKESSGGFSSITSTGSGSSGDAEHYDTKNNHKGERRKPPAVGSTSGKSSKPSRSLSPPYRIGIFSRCSEINYEWLSDRLKEEDRMRSLGIKTVCITNDEKTFRSGLQTCQFGILYHTLKYGRLNITDVTNSLYDEELREMSHSLGKENVIVVADDVRSSEPKEKERILTNQPSIPTYAEDLFVFTEEEKHTRSLKTIRDIIRRSQAKHNRPDTEHQAAPSREREPSMKAHGHFSDGHNNRITSDHQVSTKNSSPSCSASVGVWITSQNSDPAEPKPKKPKKLSSEQTNSMEGDFVLLDAPSPDLLSAPNKKWNDSQQENREPRKVIHSQEERIKELEKSLNSLTLEKNRAVESMKRIIQREERNIDGHRGEIREEENLLLQRETKGKEIREYIIPQEGGAHGHKTPPLGLGRFPEKGENVLPQEGGAHGHETPPLGWERFPEIGEYILPQEGGEHGHETPPLGLGRFPEKGEYIIPQEGGGGAHGHKTPPIGLGRFPEIGENVLPQEGGAHGHETPPLGWERFPEKGHHLKKHLQKTEGSSCLENQSMDGLLTKIEDILNEKNLKLQRQSEEMQKSS